jgi:hypothetical protein
MNDRDERVKQIGALLLNNCDKCSATYYSDQVHFCEKNETNNAEIVAKASECEGCAELKTENDKLQKRIEFIKEVRACDTHKTERSWVGWGCPDCMQEMRQRNAELVNRIEVFQKAQSKIIGELVRRGDDELIGMVNRWVSEPLPGNKRIKHGGR